MYVYSKIFKDGWTNKAQETMKIYFLGEIFCTIVSNIRKTCMVAGDVEFAFVSRNERSFKQIEIKN